MKKDMIVSLVLLAGIVSLYLSLGFMDDPRAATFPRVIIIIMGILAALLLLQSLILKRPKTSEGAGFPFGRFLICFFMIILYFLFMEALGFYFSAFLFFIAVTFIMGSADLTARKAVMRVVIGFVFTGILFFLFNVLLAVQTPKGLLL
ncbi:MAG TPA: tripartite tricarboxylate transporter TctB family protein [Desulfobacteria bacterium]|nr:tripartite tricarboxylate transporter TctB family protein [Desulfobacteria bacterium]